jgi:hypothetical protein
MVHHRNLPHKMDWPRVEGAKQQFDSRPIILPALS